MRIELAIADLTESGRKVIAEALDYTAPGKHPFVIGIRLKGRISEVHTVIANKDGDPLLDKDGDVRSEWVRA